MRVWEHHAPGPGGEDVATRMTDGEVLAFYWEWWSGEMRRKGRRGINPERCIQDWATVHWAFVVEE